ncbi:hypothetical protein [Streptomyces sp. NPDC050422]|uniref:hypothetical protein n=1 Tax=Streptomyces sp. NPDC050422 TaxID=3365614 RepID=UPI0037AEF068
MIADLADEVLHRAVEQHRAGRTHSAICDFAAAVGPAGEAASALGAVAHQLSFLNRTKHLCSQPDALDAREAAARVMDYGLGAASARAFSPPARLQAARARSTPAIPARASPPADPAAAICPAGSRGAGDMQTTIARPPLIGSLCSGYGGLDLGVQSALGGTLAWHAEVNPDASHILAWHWPGIPNPGDITTVD